MIWHTGLLGGQNQNKREANIVKILNFESHSFQQPII